MSERPTGTTLSLSSFGYSPLRIRVRQTGYAKKLSNILKKKKLLLLPMEKKKCHV